jgi:hypothetical protein
MRDAAGRARSSCTDARRYRRSAHHPGRVISPRPTPATRLRSLALSLCTHASGARTAPLRPHPECSFPMKARWGQKPAQLLSISLVFPWLDPGHLSRIRGLRMLRRPAWVPPTFRSGRGIGASDARCFASGASACHAEGRGFESHQPLQERPANRRFPSSGSQEVRLLRRPRIGQACRRKPHPHWRRRLFAGDSAGAGVSPSVMTQKVTGSSRCGPPGRVPRPWEAVAQSRPRKRAARSWERT